MAPGKNLSRLVPSGCGWMEVDVIDPEYDYSRPERCNEDSFYCEFMDYVTEDGQDAYFELALHSLPPESPVTIHIWADPEAHLREINFLKQISVSPTEVIFDASNYTDTVRINMSAVDDEWFEDLHFANVYLNVTADQESFRRMEHWLWIAVVDDERPEIIIDPQRALVYETDGGLYEQPVIDLSVEDGTAVYYVYLLSRPRREYVDVFIHIDEEQITTNVSKVRCTSDNWDIPQGVLITAINDYVDESHPFFESRRHFNITHTSESDDEFYNNLRIPNVTVTIVDDDDAELLVSRQVLAYEHRTPEHEYTINLQSQPAFTVYFNLTAIWPTFFISPSFFKIEPEDWREPVSIFTSGAGTEWAFGGVIAFLSGTAEDGTALVEPEGGRAFNLVHNLSSLDPNYNNVDNIENEFNYTQPPLERVGIVGPLPPLLEEGYMLNRYAVALKFPPVSNVTITCRAPQDQAELSHWSCTDCDNISRVKWSSIRGATIDLEFDVDNWDVEKVVWVEAIDDNVLEYNHTITINHTAQSLDAIYDSDLAPLPCAYPPCDKYDWSSALFWETQQNETGFEEAFLVQIETITFDVIDRAAAIYTFEEVPPLILSHTGGDDDGDGLNDDANRFDRVSYAPLEEDDHLVLAEGARAVSYSIHLTQPPKIKPGIESIVELRMSASDCGGRLLFNISSPEYNQTWVTDIYEEKTFSLTFTRDDFDVPHNVTVTQLQDLQYHDTSACTLTTISTCASDELFTTNAGDHQYRGQDPQGIVWFAPQISVFGFNGHLEVTLLDDEPQWMDQATYRQAGIFLSFAAIGVLALLLLADLCESPTGHLLSMSLILQQLVLTGDIARDMTDVYTSFSDAFAWATIRRVTILQDLDDFTEFLIPLFGEGVVYSIGPFYLETWIGAGSLLVAVFVFRAILWFLVTFIRCILYSKPTSQQREAHARAKIRIENAKHKRERDAIVRRLRKQKKRREEIEAKKKAAEARAELVLEEAAQRRKKGLLGKRSKVVPTGLLDNIPDGSDDDASAATDSDDESKSVNYDSIVEKETRERMRKVAQEAEKERILQAIEDRQARDKVALTRSLELFYDEHAPEKRDNAARIAEVCHADGNQIQELFQKLSDAYDDIPMWEPEDVPDDEKEAMAKMEAERNDPMVKKLQSMTPAQRTAFEERRELEVAAELEMQKQEPSTKSIFSEKELNESDWAWNAAKEHQLLRRLQHRWSFPRWELAVYLFCLGGVIFASTMRASRSVLECPSSLVGQCDDDIAANDPFSLLNANGSLVVTYRYNYSEGDGLLITTPPDEANFTGNYTRLLERNFYWWDTNGYDSLEGFNDDPMFQECGGILGPACEGCHCGVVPLPYSDIEYSSALGGRLPEWQILTIAGVIAGSFALVVPLALMLIVLLSFGSCAIYFGRPKYFRKRWASMQKCNGFVVVWGGLLFDSLRRDSFGYLYNFSLIVDMIHFAVLAGVYRADTSLFHDHARTALSVHLSLVVIRVAYFVYSRPFIKPRNNWFPFFPALYSIVNDSVLLSLFDGGDNVKVEVGLLFWNVCCVSMLLAFEAFELFNGPITKLRQFYQKFAARRQQQRKMLRVTMEMKDLEREKVKRGIREREREEKEEAERQELEERERLLRQTANNLVGSNDAHARSTSSVLLALSDQDLEDPKDDKVSLFDEPQPAAKGEFDKNVPDESNGSTVGVVGGGGGSASGKSDIVIPPLQLSTSATLASPKAASM